MPTPAPLPSVRSSDSSAFANHEAALAWLGAFAFAVVFGYPLIGRMQKVGGRFDWPVSLARDWVPAFTVTHFHQMPLWNPYACGGISNIGSPATRTVNPFFLLHLLYGPIVGFHLEILFSLALGWGGGYFLARTLKLSPLAAVVCASIFAGSSWLPLHLAAGHFAFLTGLYLPWIVGFMWISMTRDDLRSAGFAAMFLALAIGGGGVYMATHAVLLLGFVAIGIALQRRSLMPLVMLIAFGAFGFGFSAIKLLPEVVFQLAHGRIIGTQDYDSIANLLDALLSRDQAILKPLSPAFQRAYGYWEYGAYIGIPAALMILVAIVREPRRAMPWILAGVAMLVFAGGQLWPGTSPWDLLRHLPVYSEERVAARFLILFGVAASVMAGFGIDALQNWRAVGAIIAPLLAVVCIVDLWIVDTPNLYISVEAGTPVVTSAATFRQYYSENRLGTMWTLPLSNAGAVHCAEYTEIPTRVAGSNQAGYRGEQYLLAPGSLTLTRWSPNELRFDVATATPNVLVINQNFDKGWHLAGGGGQTFSYQDLLAVRLEPGSHQVRLEYSNRYFNLGAAITLLTLGGFFLLPKLHYLKREQPSAFQRTASH